MDLKPFMRQARYAASHSYAICYFYYIIIFVIIFQGLGALNIGIWIDGMVFDLGMMFKCYDMVFGHENPEFQTYA